MASRHSEDEQGVDVTGYLPPGCVAGYDVDDPVGVSISNPWAALTLKL